MGFFDIIRNLFYNKKKTATIKAPDFSKIYGSPDAFKVLLMDGVKPLANKTVTIEVHGVKYSRVTDNTGIATLNINLSCGEYEVKIEFQDNNYQLIKTSANITVSPKIITNDLNMNEKDGSKFQARVTDNSNNNLEGIKVIFNIHGVKYERTSDKNGIASLNINLTQGTYEIITQSYKTMQNNIISISQPKQKTDSKHFGYWVFGKNMYDVNIDTLKTNGVTDIFLNYFAIKTHGVERVEEWIQKVQPMNVHIWMQCFYDGEWHNPKTTDLSSRIKEAKSYSDIKGIKGIHLDYLRYPGNAYKTEGGVEAITDFTRQIKENISQDIILSCAVMPENESKKYYGQDIEALGKIVDIVIPMQYKGNYNAGTDWLISTTKRLSKQAKIWSGLQAYKSDEDTTILPQNEIINDIQTCLNNGAEGVLLFRYGLSSNVNFTQFNNNSKIFTRMEGTDINMTYKDGTQYQCAVYDTNNNRVNDTVDLTINGVTYQRTANNEGLYKLNINLNPGNYTLDAKFAGNNIYLGSSISNSIIINEVPKNTSNQTVPVKLYDYFTQQGGGRLGQTNGSRCGPHSTMQAYHRLTGIDVSESELASAMGSTDAGTSHLGIETGLAYLNKKYGTNVKIKWMNFSDLSNTQAGRFTKMQELINKGAVFIHLLYRDQYGHYEVPKGMSGNTVVILNSLGSYCNYPAYCGYIENRSQSAQLSYISGISQKSVAYMYI